MTDKTINININAPGRHVIRVNGFMKPLGLKKGMQLHPEQVNKVKDYISKEMEETFAKGEPMVMSGGFEFIPTEIVIESQ